LPCAIDQNCLAIEETAGNVVSYITVYHKFLIFKIQFTKNAIMIPNLYIKMRL